MSEVVGRVEKDEKYYEKIGFMCGLEIHQRLATRVKLFCSCTSTLPGPEDGENAEITRYQRAVAGELGVIDRAASFEQTKDRKFTYLINNSHACLVDIDEEPPHNMNREALLTALSIVSAMKMVVPDELQPMRKQVVDGSNPSAFQRTTKIGINGRLNVGGHEIKIISAFVEEESAGIESNTEEGTTYETGRIGIPLIEIDTDPWIRSPVEAKEAALKIGTLLRLTGKVRRGIGSIRQDVNVSIKGGARVEIKGLQDVDFLDRFVENEVLRQQNLLRIKERLAKSKASVGEPKDLTSVLKDSKAKIISSAIDSGGIVSGFALQGFKGIIGTEVNPDRRLGSEISDYAKMGGVKGIIHSDEDMSKYGMGEKEFEATTKALGIGSDDAFVLIAGRKEAVKTAIGFAINRSKAAITNGVLLETRGAVNNDLYTTRFLRPLPGGSRMYPETDATPVQVTRDMLSEASSSAPDIEKERSQLMSDLKTETLAEQIMVSPRLALYKEITKKTKADRIFIANILLQKFTELKRNNYNVDGVSGERLAELFNAYSENKITKSAVEEALKLLSSKDMPVQSIIKENNLGRISGKELKAIIDRETKDSGAETPKGEIQKRVMSKHRLNVDGEDLKNMLEK